MHYLIKIQATMKQILFFATFLILFSSCSKEEIVIISDLTGQWVHEPSDCHPNQFVISISESNTLGGFSHPMLKGEFQLINGDEMHFEGKLVYTVKKLTDDELKLKEERIEDGCTYVFWRRT